MGNWNAAWLGLGLLPLSGLIYVLISGNSLLDPGGYTPAGTVDYVITIGLLALCVLLSATWSRIKGK